MNDYTGRYPMFDYSRLKRYPISTRPNKVTLADLIDPEQVLHQSVRVDTPELRSLVEGTVEATQKGWPVLWFNGAHLIKNGLGPLVADLIKRGIVTHYATNGAGTIHDFELAMIGETSENVPNALPEGKFGLAYETGRFMNLAIAQGYRRGWGMGEALARFMLGDQGKEKVEFPHKNVSVVVAAFEAGIPVTVHVGLGADIVHEHPEFDGAATGATSGWDFGIYASTVERMTEGGVVFNVGSAVAGPEVLLKTVSMASNVGRRPGRIVTADFDIRPIVPEEIRDESKPTYYFRDVKSVVTRIPEAFGGRGNYVHGDQKETVPALYKLLVDALG